MTTQGGQDRIYAALNPLVLDGTLTPHQADRVYQAVAPDTADDMAGTAYRGPTGGGLDRPRLLAAASVLAAGLLATAYVVGAVVDEDNGTGWKSVLMLLGTALVVAAAGAAWFVLLRSSGWWVWVSGALGALGFAGLAFSILVLWDGSDAAVYVTGLLMLAGGAAGFWFLKGQLYTLVAVLGGALVLGQIFSDTLSDSADEGDILTVGIAFLFYGLVVGAAGWFLGVRRLLGMVGLSIAGSAMFLVMVVNAFALAFAASFSDPNLQVPDSGATPGSVRSDIRVALLLGLLVVVLAALAHAYDGFNGFAVITFIGAAVLPVTAFYSWHTEHPIRWATGFAVIGGLGLAAIVGLQLDRRTRGPRHGYGGAPVPPEQPYDPNADTLSR